MICNTRRIGRYLQMSSEMPLSCGRQRVGFLALLPTLLRRLGADAGDALMQAGLAPDSLDDPTKFVPFKSAAELLVASARLTDCQQFGFMLGEQIRPQMLGLAGELMCNAPTLGAALRDFNSMQYTNSTSSVSYLIVTGGQAMQGFSVVERDVEGVAYIYDTAAVAALNIVCSLTGADQSHATLSISHDEPRDLTELRHKFTGPVIFDADATGVMFPASWLTLPVRGADVSQRKGLQDRVNATRRSDVLGPLAHFRREVWVALMCGNFHASEVAERMGYSKRLLQRHLHEAGTTYSEVLDQTRCEMASQLLTNTMISFSSISLLLRYSEQSVFSRSFRLWTGVTPLEFRRRRLVLNSERQYLRARAYDLVAAH